MSKTLTLTSGWYEKLSEEKQVKMAGDLADLCSPIEEVATLRSLLEETDSYTITMRGRTPVAFRIGDLACPAEEDPSAVGGRRRRSRGSGVKKQTRRTKGKRRRTVRK
jgi:hypothetical protein